MTNLTFVEIQNDQAYIDRRVYCAEIIEVEHSTWMRDIFKKIPKSYRIYVWSN